jgi:beta-mannanase
MMDSDSDNSDSGNDHTFKMNTLLMEKYKSLEAQLTKPIIFDELGEVSDDVYDWKNDRIFIILCA